MKSLTPGKFVDSKLEFQKAHAQANRSRENFKNICEIYKSFLDANFTGRFCTDGHCKKIFMVEISFDDFKWGATPRIFDTEHQAKREIEALKHRYPFITEYRIVEKEEKE